MDITISPRGSMLQLSKIEVARLQQSAQSKLYQLYRRCSLAVLSSGAHSDDAEQLFSAHHQFQINIVCVERGIKIQLTNPPQSAFVDGHILTGIQEHLFSVLRDVLFQSELPTLSKAQHSEASHQLTNHIFDLLRHARVLSLNQDPNLIVCWGGHSINDAEYRYTKDVGYELGLRYLDVCTGCGPGAMKGPMKGKYWPC